MAGSAANRASRLSTYSGRSSARLRLPALAALLGLGLTCSGCAVSGSLLGGEDSAKAYAKADPETTGSVPSSTPAAAPNLPSEADLVYARAAVSEVLTRGAKTTSASWENPKTGARGTVTPIASAYTQGGRTCHDFLASYVLGGSESWMQGEACRGADRSKWEVRTMRPWKRS